MTINFGHNPGPYKDITYQLNWMLDPIAKPCSTVENLNDFKEARQLINKIKQDVRNANK